jgi:hypothetical protein
MSPSRASGRRHICPFVEQNLKPSTVSGYNQIWSQHLKAHLAQSLALAAERGVRVLSDYLPPRVSRSDEYERIFELERKLGRRPEFAAVARYTHCLAHRVGPVMKDVT